MQRATAGRRPRRRIVTTAFLALAAIYTYPVAFSETLNQLLYGEPSGRDQTTGSRERSEFEHAREIGAATNSEFLRAALKEAGPELDEMAVRDALQFVSSLEHN